MNHKNAALLLSFLLLAACGQVVPPSATLPTPPVGSTPAQGTAILRVFIPNKELQPQYLPSTTSGLRVRLGTFDQTFPVGAGAAGCTAVSGGVSCTFTLTVAAGTDLTLRLDALDTANHVLSTASQTVTVVKGQNNAFDVLLTGVAAAGLGSLTPTDRASEVSATTASATLDRGGAFTFGVALRDASGQTIIDPGLPSFKVCSSNAAFTVAGAATSTPVVTAPEPTGTAQTTTLFIPTDGNCSTTAGPLASTTLTVPAFQLAVTVPATIVSGGSAVASAQLLTAQGHPLTVAGRSVQFMPPPNTSVTPNLATTDATGKASVNVIVNRGTFPTSKTLTATSDGVSGTANFNIVAGDADATTSSVVVTPGIVKVGEASSVSVTLKDASGIPVTTRPP